MVLIMELKALKEYASNEYYYNNNDVEPDLATDTLIGNYPFVCICLYGSPAFISQLK